MRCACSGRSSILPSESASRRSCARSTADAASSSACLSHELRNPLAVIGSAVHCIDRTAIARRPGSSRGRLSSSARRVTSSRLVDDLLDITRVRSGKIDLQRTSVDLVQLVRTTVEDHRELLADRVVTVKLPEVRAWTQWRRDTLGADPRATCSATPRSSRPRAARFPFRLPSRRAAPCSRWPTPASASTPSRSQQSVRAVRAS